ncbi:contractile tail sheath protein [Synechococcus phage S-RSM4]|uniref:Contractile tail sheath protein n=1 Tax=Synechococcus phage S-RSM4 TaxID=555387 RepID=C7BV79_9CAUD|nr:tail sheath [Synechococcus phage S-RSM4]CAR63308.1 contractile tail sheath protein [Synechococcus phage S-RSM4]
MASQVSPGVVIRERDFSNAVVVGATAIRGAFASSFRTGPVGKIVNIGSERELIDTFGTPAEANAADWLVASEFLRYGGQLAVVRAASGVLNATESGTGVLIGDKDAFDAGVTSEKFAARYAGADGNNLRVVIVDRGADWVITKANHGLSVGGTYTDDAAVAYEVYAVPNANTIHVVGTTTPTPAAGDTASAWDYNSQAIASTGLTYKSIAPRPGTSAFASERYLSYDEVHVAVIDESTNTVVERLTYLSKLSDAKTPEGASSYWKDYVNEYSRYVYAGDTLSASEVTTVGEDPGATAASYGATSGSPLALARILPTAGGALSGGADDYAYTSGEIQAAYDEFLDTEQTTVDFVLMGGDAANETDTIAKAQAVAAIANSRKDCIAFISPWTGTQVATSGGAALTPATQLANTLAFFDNIGSSSYVILDSGVKYTYDRFNDKYRYVGCNGDVAGLCVSTSASLDDWFSPAGLNRGGIQNVVKLAFNPNKAQRDDLYTNRINPIVSLPGSGPVLFGDKTGLASPSAFDRINVRRLFLNVEKRARALAEGVLFEQNDSTTRGSFAASMGSYLQEIQSRRGLTDFLVVCDTSNNTPEVIDRNEFVAELYLKPTRSINYVTVTVTATRTGVSFAEVIGR